MLKLTYVVTTITDSRLVYASGLNKMLHNDFERLCRC